MDGSPFGAGRRTNTLGAATRRGNVTRPFAACEQRETNCEGFLSADGVDWRVKQIRMGLPSRSSLMGRKYFGTDGIRGRANAKITADVAMKVGQAAGLAFHRGDHRHRVVIGKDTRLSSYMIEYALVAGFT